METLRTELHCHNEFSNFHVGGHDTPYDCSVTVRQQLEQASALGLDVLFVTNHNTLDGYRQMLEYKKDHERFSGMHICPAEEITIADGSHVIAYGLTEPVRPGLSFDETLDEIRRQDCISSAPHPFGLLDAVRERARDCDLIEVFNSNNVDILANTRAALFADEHGLTGIAGSDSHVMSTIGRCVNLIDCENNHDDILSAMKKGRIRVESAGYATALETLEHLRYKAENSADFIHEYLSEFYPRSRQLFLLLYRIFERNPDSYLWILFYKIAVRAMKRISKKINFEGDDPDRLRDRDLGTIIQMTLK